MLFLVPLVEEVVSVVAFFNVPGEAMKAGFELTSRLNISQFDVNGPLLVIFKPSQIKAQWSITTSQQHAGLHYTVYRL